MSMIKWLQGAVVAMFVLMVGAGVFVLFFAEAKMNAFGQLIGIIWPVFLTSVVPALIGSPLTDFVRAHAAAIGGQGEAAKPSEVSTGGEAPAGVPAVQPEAHP